jgi:putative Mg2+ transporter-C (MgtC) family protein
MRDLSLLALFGRLALAAGAALAIGFERQLRSQAAGMRTHALVSLGAALFTIAGAYGFADLPHPATIDPARIGAQVASGIGFLGAGAIIRHGVGVRGLTTAATLWMAAAVGVAAGAGAVAAVLLATAAVLLVLIGLRLARPVMSKVGTTTTRLEVEFEAEPVSAGPVLVCANALGTKVLDIEVEDAPGLSPGRRLRVTVQTRRTADLEVFAEELRKQSRVCTVRTADTEL